MCILSQFFKIGQTSSKWNWSTGHILLTPKVENPKEAQHANKSSVSGVGIKFKERG